MASNLTVSVANSICACATNNVVTVCVLGGTSAATVAPHGATHNHASRHRPAWCSRAERTGWSWTWRSNGRAVTLSSSGLRTRLVTAGTTSASSGHGDQHQSATQTGLDSLPVAATAVSATAGTCQPLTQHAAATRPTAMAGMSTCTGRATAGPRQPGRPNNRPATANAGQNAMPTPCAHNTAPAAATGHDMAHTTHHRRTLVPHISGNDQRRLNGRATRWPSPANMYLAASGPNVGTVVRTSCRCSLFGL